MIFLAGCIFYGCSKELDPAESGLLVPKTVDQDPSLPSISVNGSQFHAETFGHPDSAMVVVLHGGPGADYRYLLNCKDLAGQGYYVVFYDQRGSGLSKRHPKSSYSIQIMLDDLTAVIAHYRKSPHQKVFLLGHSWGGMLATAYINAYPEAISGAIIAEPGGFTYDDMVEYITRSRPGLNTITSEITNDAVFFDQMLTGKEDEHAILDYKSDLQAASDGAEGNLIGNTGRLPYWRSGAIVFEALFEIADKDGFDWTKNLSQYQTKVLFVYSELNQAYGLNHAQKVSSAFPLVQLSRTDGAGHDMIAFPTGWSNFYPTALTYLNSLK